MHSPLSNRDVLTSPPIAKGESEWMISLLLRHPEHTLAALVRLVYYCLFSDLPKVCAQLGSPTHSVSVGRGGGPGVERSALKKVK